MRTVQGAGTAAVGEGGERPRTARVCGGRGGWWGDGEVGESKRAGEHALMRRWVRVVGETARWAGTRARACTSEGR